jgi:hypothetical protein
MSSEVYKIMNAVIQSTDLLHSGHLLIEFANAVYKEKSRVTIVKEFYKQLYQWAFSEYIFGDLINNEKSNVFICDESKAARMYLALVIPSEVSTVKTINGIKTFGEYILSHYTEPVGKCITESSLKNILQFLDKEYLFSSKVFLNRKTIFIRIHNSHKDYNSECLTVKDRKGIVNHFFLYHMKKKNSLSPEAVLFHELGHALHAQRFGDITKVPDNIIEILQNLCFPNLRQMDPMDQSELLADVLSVGLMYQTPYEKHDIYKKIHTNDKKVFKMLVEKIIESL